MKKYFKIVAVYLLLTIFSCSDVKSIIDGGAFADPSGNSIKTFYIYDYVNLNKLNDHLRKTSSPDQSTTVNYYFSHNSNIPSSSLKYAKSIPDAKNIIKDYSESEKVEYFNNFDVIPVSSIDEVIKESFCDESFINEISN